MSERRQAGDGLLGWLDCGGRRHPIAAKEAVQIGRDPGVAISFTDETVSWRHAVITAEAGTATIWDGGSHNGTFVDGEQVRERGARLRHGALVHFGDLEATFLAANADGRTGRLPQLRRYALERELRIGRDTDNDVVLAGAGISRHHARVRAGAPATVEDLRSRNGTRLGGKPITVSAIAPGDELGVGAYRLGFDGRGLTVDDGRGDIGLQGINLTAAGGGRTILRAATLTVGRGEMMALIGPSGAGKSTLLRILAGVSAPASGQVLLDGEPIAPRLSEIGYVPQHDTIHERLTVAEALTYAALLRLPADTSEAEIAANVEAVLAELGLSDRAEVRIGLLSGGQRKRAACGVELVGEPSLLLLDEPTSGLDPPLEREMMVAIRAMGDRGRGVVVTTHATGSLALCDTLAIVAPGGRLAFVGPPQQALERFGADAYDDLYSKVEKEDGNGAGETASASPRRSPGAARETGGLGERSFARQLAVLTGRYRRTLLRDRRTIAVLLGQVPAIALLIALLFSADVFALPAEDAGKSAQFVFLLVTAALWLGLISSCREIVNERPIVLREIAIGTRVGAYLGAKAIVLFVLSALQAAILLLVATALRPLHESPLEYVELYVVLMGTAWAAVGIGLAVSTYARGVDQATSFVPLLLIPQLLFAGALVTVHSMDPAVKVFSGLVVARWAFAGAGSAVELNDRFVADPAQAALYGDRFFAIQPAAAVGATLVFAVAGLLIAGLLLERRATQPAS
ncbi:MAG TPA: ATP-binding cassette domain-containing protein [Solirubrobacterales bacterium]